MRDGQALSRRIRDRIFQSSSDLLSTDDKINMTVQIDVFSDNHDISFFW
jgi:hypothetical protein